MLRLLEGEADETSVVVPQIGGVTVGYAEELAEYRERETCLDEGKGEDEVEERSEYLPDNVPTKAAITIKEINNNRYYYWQWRDGDKIRSQYKDPVNPDK